MGIWQALLAFGTILFGVAIWSRLVNDRQVPGLITGATDAMSNIFRGVFRG